mgnify:CR=1 FL=1
MHLLGLACGGLLDWRHLVLIRRERRGVAKLYRVVEVEDIAPGISEVHLADGVARYCRRRDLIFTATRFSQVGRPRRRSRKGPLVVLDIAAGQALPGLLQARKILFQAVRRTPGPGTWCVCAQTGRAGSEFRVPDPLLAATLADVRKQDRVIVGPDNDAVFDPRHPCAAGR